jgi:hypothetical protein
MTSDHARLEAALKELRSAKLPIDLPTIERTLLVILEHLVAQGAEAEEPPLSGA